MTHNEVLNKAKDWWNSLLHLDKLLLLDAYNILRNDKLSDDNLFMIYSKEHNLITSAEQLDEIMDEIFDEQDDKDLEDLTDNQIEDLHIKHIKIYNANTFEKNLIHFSNEEKIKMLNLLVCSISTTDPKFNSLLNQISNY